MFAFPDAPTLRTRLMTSECFKATPYFQEKGIDRAISDLVAKRFASSEVNEMGIKMGVMLALYDLQNGKDGFTGEALPKFDGLPAIFWNILGMGLEEDLKKCKTS